MSQAARRVAHAIRRGAQDHATSRGRPHARGRILSLTPLAIDVLGIDLTLDENDVEYSVDVLRFDASEGLRAGDTLLLAEVEEGDWVALTVLSDTAVRPVA